MNNSIEKALNWIDAAVDQLDNFVSVKKYKKVGECIGFLPHAEEFEFREYDTGRVYYGKVGRRVSEMCSHAEEYDQLIHAAANVEILEVYLSNEETYYILFSIELERNVN